MLPTPPSMHNEGGNIGRKSQVIVNGAGPMGINELQRYGGNNNMNRSEFTDEFAREESGMMRHEDQTDQNNSGLTREMVQYSAKPMGEGVTESIILQKVPMLRGLSEGSRGTTSELHKSSQRYSNQDPHMMHNQFLNYISP
jgi:hypothetical protein